MTEFNKTNLNTLKRTSNRGHYDQETIYKILDAGYICHVGFAIEKQPFVIPMAYGRKKDYIYLHSSIKGRLRNVLSNNELCCITVTHLDGLVLSRSAFDHSMNYRSVVLFGNTNLVKKSENKRQALKIISDNLIPDRWDEVRPPSDNEIKATSIISVHIKEASAKIRSGPPKDNRKDLDLSVWAGVIPFEVIAKTPVSDPDLRNGILQDKSVKDFKIKK